ncbi:MAG: DNA polymerase IV [Gammaproteobacteria bacterium]
MNTPNDLNICPLYWPRAIILIDMNAFFASIEQLDFPDLRHKPVAVTNGIQGTCIITCSYEARAYGIKTGMRLRDAKQLCPKIIQRPSRPERYTQISRKIMKNLIQITPDIEIFSVDEAFLDVTHCQMLYGNPVRIARMAQRLVYDVSRLSCSIGISGDKTTAKYAAKLQKPNGFIVIPPWESKERLSHVPVTELCGIAAGIGNFLAKYGVYTCGQIEKLPIGILTKRFGPLGQRIWYMCQGADPDPVHTSVAAPKSMGHGKVMPPNTTTPNIVWTYLRHMCDKLATRLRRHHMKAQYFFVGLRSYEFGWLGDHMQLPIPSNDAGTIYYYAKKILLDAWEHEPVWHIQVTALDPEARPTQLDLFTKTDLKSDKKNVVLDQINARFGDYTLTAASLLNRSKMPNVIAPAWKPDGHRQSI